MRLVAARVFVRFRPLCRMRAAVSFQQLAQARASVDLRRVALGVTENLLDHRQLGPVLVHQRRHCVAKDVAGTRLFNACRLDVTAGILGQ